MWAAGGLIIGISAIEPEGTSFSVMEEVVASLRQFSWLFEYLFMARLTYQFNIDGHIPGLSPLP